MTAGQTFKAFCPLVMAEVGLEEIYLLEPGGSCQVDISFVDKQCSLSDSCAFSTHPKCLQHIVD